VRLPLHVNSEDGFSLAELLVTIVLVSVTFVAILTGLMTTIRVSAVHRAQSATDAVARSAAEWVKDSNRNPYSTACNPLGMYSLSGLQMPSGYTATIKPVEFWNGAPVTGGTYTVQFGTYCSGGDQGLQRITIVASSPNGDATETVQVIKRSIP
jgi:prepilin-type N-terminal cleavage/methylation domain-containing protein